MFKGPAGEQLSTDMSNNVTLTGFRSISDSQKPPSHQSREAQSQVSELPPCRICGEAGTGLHYGVNSCDACKAFFQRALTRKKSTEFKCKCSKQKNGKTDIARKTMCPKCRYEKCIAEGMSKEAIKIGRYTTTRKRQNNAEVQMHRGSQAVTEKTPLDASPCSDSSGVFSEDAESNSPVIPQRPKKPKQTGKKREKDEMLYKQTGEKREEDGMLYKAFSDSIYRSLLENQQGTTTTELSDLNQSDDSLMQKLFMQPFDPNKSDRPITAPNEPITAPNEVSEVNNQPIRAQNEIFTDLPVSVDNGNNGLQMSSGSAVRQNGDDILLATPINQHSQIQPIIEQNEFSQPITEKSGFHQPITEQIGNHQSGFYQPITEQIGNHQPIGEQNVSNQPIAEQLEFHQPIINGNDGGFLIDNVSANPVTCHRNRLSNIAQKNPNEFLDSDKLALEEIHNECLNGEEGPLIGDASDLDLIADQIARDFVESERRDGEVAWLERYVRPVLSPGNGISVEEIHAIIQNMMDGKMSIYMEPLKVSEEEIRQRHSLYLEQYQLKQELFGEMPDLSMEEYLEVYKQTGIDIDNRQEIVIETLRFIEDAIRKMVKFVKCIPGFSQLLLEDQVNLIKASRKEHDVIQNGPCLRLSSGVTTAPWNKEYHIDEIQRAFPQMIKICALKSKIYSDMDALHLTTEMALVLCGLIVTFSDRCALKKRDQVDVIHDKLVACLHYLLNQCSPGASTPSIQDIMVFLYSLRHLTKIERDMLLDVLEIWPANNDHQLVKEFVS